MLSGGKLIFLLLWVSGCTSAIQPEPAYVKVAVDQGDMSRVDLAFEETIIAFVGPHAVPGSGGTGGLVGEIPVSTFTERGTKTPVNRNTTRSVTVTIGQILPLNQHVEAGYSVSLVHAKSNYTLPKGAGVLTDPIRVDFTTNALDLEAKLSWRILAHRQHSPMLDVGVGTRLAQTKTQVNSAILDVRHHSKHTDEFLSLGVRQSIPLSFIGASAPSLGLEARARGYGRNRATYMLGAYLLF